MKQLQALVFTLLLLLPMVAVGQTTAQAQEPTGFLGQDLTSWYTTLHGVLNVPDEMPLYPYGHGAFMVGISKFGETANPFGDQFNNYEPVGVNYNGYDPILNPNILINKVVAGWKLVVTYHHPTASYRTLWAYAKFSDLTRAGSPAEGPNTGDCKLVQGGWIVCPYEEYGIPAVKYDMADSPALTPHGGRKTNGIMETAAFSWLYDGPRRAIVATTSTLYDYWLAQDAGDDYHDYPVATISFIFDLNKDTKELTIIKDVKIELPQKNALDISAADCKANSLAIAGTEYLGAFPDSKSNVHGLACFELDNNEEIDQGSKVKGFAHFYVINYPVGVSPYTYPAKPIQTDESELTEKILVDLTATVKGTDDQEYHWDSCMTGVAANCRPNDKYAVAQMIDQDWTYAVKKAYWPHPDWWTVDAYEDAQLFSKLENVRLEDMTNEPETVGTAAQWNFILDGVSGRNGRMQWRSVETIGIVQLTGDFNPLHTADDKAMITPPSPAGANNVIDKEFYFLDDMVFNPWDLREAVHKQTDRQVQFFSGDGTQTGFTLTEGAAIVVANAEWDSYASFSERVLVNEELQTRPTDYALAGNVITFDAAPPSGFNNIKVLYSTRPIHEKLDYVAPVRVGATLRLQYGPADSIDFIMIRNGTTPTLSGWSNATALNYTCRSETAEVPCAGGTPGQIYYVRFADNWDEGKVVYKTARGTYDWLVVGRDAHSVDSIGGAYVSEAFDSKKNIEVDTTGMDMQDTTLTTIPYILEKQGTGDTKDDYKECNVVCIEEPRAHLRDDWSSVDPVDSSNIILVGGPLANVATEMVNDWASVNFIETGFFLWGVGEWDAFNPHTGGMMGWDAHGGAAIGTYMDIDGTVYLFIWGGTGEDTYWATYHWWNSLLVHAQTENPGVTSWILTIDYTDTHAPTITIVKRLNTISEKVPEQDP
jgi:hypothetical protein